jgi:plastocyanin
MKKVAVAFALILASFALVACGSSSDDTSGTGAETTESQTETDTGKAEGGSAGSAAVLDIEAAPTGLAYSSDSASAKAGKVTLNFTNPQALVHDVAIEDSSGKTIGQTELITEGTDSTTVNLKSAEYTFYCTVPGHREAGMEGALNVE